MASPLDYINAGFSGISALGGLFTANSDQKAAIRLQKQLLQAQQKFAHDEAALNRDFQKQMWDASNAYNDPSAQVSRLSAAGLNPALAYGGSMATAAPTSGSAASAPGAPQVDMLSGKSLMAAQIANLAAQTEQIRAETKKTNADTDTALTFNKYQEQMLTGQVEALGIQVKTGLAGIKLTEQETKKSYQITQNLIKEGANLQATLDKLKAETANVKADTYSKRVETFLNSQRTEAMLKKMASETHLNYTQARTMVEQLLINSRVADSQISLNSATEAGITLTNGRIAFDFEIDQGGTSQSSFRAWERKSQAAGLVSRELFTFVQQFQELFSW